MAAFQNNNDIFSTTRPVTHSSTSATPSAGDQNADTKLLTCNLNELTEEDIAEVMRKRALNDYGLKVRTLQGL